MKNRFILHMSIWEGGGIKYHRRQTETTLMSDLVMGGTEQTFMKTRAQAFRNRNEQEQVQDKVL